MYTLGRIQQTTITGAKNVYHLRRCRKERCLNWAALYGSGQVPLHASCRCLNKGCMPNNCHIRWRANQGLFLLKFGSQTHMIMGYHSTFYSDYGLSDGRLTISSSRMALQRTKWNMIFYSFPIRLVARDLHTQLNIYVNLYNHIFFAMEN